MLYEYYFKQHIQAVHEEKKMFTKCQLCEYVSPAKHCLAKRIQGVIEGKKPFKCEHIEYAPAEKRWSRKI